MAKGAKRQKSEATASEGETEIPPLTEEDVVGLAETLSKEQLVSIVKEAAISDSDLQRKLRNLADEDPAGRKLFVRGLKFSTDRESLKKAFQEYGAVKDSKVIVDKSSGKSKGYGFVTFRHRDCALRALKEPNKKIDGRQVICHLSGARDADVASAPPLLQVTPETVSSSRKVYVGNVPKSTQKDTVRTFFSQYGEIEEGPLGFDKNTGKCKGYSLIVYKSHDSVRKCLLEPTKTIDGHKVHCKLADTNKNKDEGVNPSSSALGYDVTNPALVASHNPSFLQSGAPIFGRLPLAHSDLSSLHGMNALMPHTAALLGRESAYTAGALSSLYGLPFSNTSANRPLAPLQDPHGLGYSSLPRSSYL